MNKYYAGIGSRETPKDILELMGSIARGLYRQGYVLRSGGAPGADQAFEWAVWRHAPDAYHAIRQAEIYLPWASFEQDNRSPIIPRLTEPQEEAFQVAEFYHPRFRYLKYGAKKLIARNSHQIFGPDIGNPIKSDFVVCWTKGAKGGGGTGQAIRIASAIGIPVYDLANSNALERLKERIEVG